MKTLLRFSDSDIEVLVKRKGTNEPYVVVPLEEIETQAPIPKYDHSISWKKIIYRPARQKAQVTGKVCPPSLKGSRLQLRQLSSSSSDSTLANPSKKYRKGNSTANATAGSVDTTGSTAAAGSPTSGHQDENMHDKSI